MSRRHDCFDHHEEECCCCCGLDCKDLIALAIVLGLGVVFFTDGDKGIFAAVIVILAILALS